MTTSISSEARRNHISILIRGREIMFPPKPDGQTDRHTDGRTYGRTDINIYRVASLLKTMVASKLISQCQLFLCNTFACKIKYENF